MCEQQSIPLAAELRRTEFARLQALVTAAAGAGTRAVLLGLRPSFPCSASTLLAPAISQACTDELPWTTTLMHWPSKCVVMEVV